VNFTLLPFQPVFAGGVEGNGGFPFDRCLHLSPSNQRLRSMFGEGHHAANVLASEGLLQFEDTLCCLGRQGRATLRTDLADG
jgi:hypothetical protein